MILLDTLDQEVTKFRECNALLDLNSLVGLDGIIECQPNLLVLSVPCRGILNPVCCLQFIEAKVYHNKLVNIRKEMITIHEKTTKLKVPPAPNKCFCTKFEEMVQMLMDRCH